MCGEGEGGREENAHGIRGRERSDGERREGGLNVVAAEEAGV